MNETSHPRISEFEDAVSAETDSFRAADPIQIALRYKYWLTGGLLAGILIGSAAYFQFGAEYVARSKVLVSKKVGVPVSEDDTASLPNFGERGEHIALIMSPMIIERAVEQGRLDKLPSLRKSDDPVEDILDGLKVKRSAGQDESFLNVLEIEFTTTNKHDAEAVVTAVIDAYREYLNDSREENSNEVMRQVTEANNKALADLKTKQNEYMQFRLDAPLHWENAPGAGDTPGEVTNVHRERILALERELERNLIRRAEINSRLRALDESIAAGHSRESLELMIRELLSRDTTVAQTNSGNDQAALDAQLLPLLIEEKRLLRDFGPNHPDVQQVRQSIQLAVDFYRQKGVALPPFATPQQPSPEKDGPDFVAVYRQSLLTQLTELGHRDAELNEEFDKQALLAKDLSQFQLQDQAHHDEIVRIKGMADALTHQLNTLNLAKQSAGYRLKSIAPVRAELSIKRVLKIVGAGGLAGLGTVFGIVYLLALTDTRLNSVDDLRPLGCLVLGSVPEFAPIAASQSNSPNTSRMHGSLCYVHRPHSIEAESYRGIRTALFHSADASESKLIQITSPESHDGKTTLTANLAVAIAQSGRRTLVIDADLRRSMVASVFGARQEIGLTDVISQEIELANAIQDVGISGLSILSAGSATGNPAECLTSPNFKNVLETAGREFDIVLIDTPPVLAVSDPCVVAGHVDGALIVLRLEKNRQAVVERAIDRFRQHRVRILGLIANGEKPGADSLSRHSYAGYSAPNEPKRKPQPVSAVES